MKRMRKRFIAFMLAFVMLFTTGCSSGGFYADELPLIEEDVVEGIIEEEQENPATDSEKEIRLSYDTEGTEQEDDSTETEQEKPIEEDSDGVSGNDIDTEEISDEQDLSGNDVDEGELPIGKNQYHITNDLESFSIWNAMYIATERTNYGHNLPSEWWDNLTEAERFWADMLIYDSTHDENMYDDNTLEECIQKIQSGISADYFFEGTVFQGISLDDLIFMKENWYSLDDLNDILTGLVLRGGSELLDAYDECIEDGIFDEALFYMVEIAQKTYYYQNYIKPQSRSTMSRATDDNPVGSIAKAHALNTGLKFKNGTPVYACSLGTPAVPALCMNYDKICRGGFTYECERVMSNNSSTFGYLIERLNRHIHSDGSYSQGGKQDIGAAQIIAWITLGQLKKSDGSMINIFTATQSDVKSLMENNFDSDTAKLYVKVWVMLEIAREDIKPRTFYRWTSKNANSQALLTSVVPVDESTLPKITTEATVNGAKEVSLADLKDGKFTITDTVTYTNCEEYAGKKATLTGWIMVAKPASTGSRSGQQREMVVIPGKPPTVTWERVPAPDPPPKEITIGPIGKGSFEFEYELTEEDIIPIIDPGTPEITIVIYSELTIEGGKKIVHKSTTDTKQTITIIPDDNAPSLRTQATTADGQKNIDIVTSPTGQVTIKDTITCRNIENSPTGYTLKGWITKVSPSGATTILADTIQTIPAPLVNGEGTFEMSFTVDKSTLVDGDKLVVCEELFNGTDCNNPANLNISHANLADTAQTVVVGDEQLTTEGPTTGGITESYYCETTLSTNVELNKKDIETSMDLQGVEFYFSLNHSGDITQCLGADNGTLTTDDGGHCELSHEDRLSAEYEWSVSTKDERITTQPAGTGSTPTTTPTVIEKFKYTCPQCGEKEFDSAAARDSDGKDHCFNHAKELAEYDLAVKINGYSLSWDVRETNPRTTNVNATLSTGGTDTYITGYHNNPQIQNNGTESGYGMTKSSTDLGSGSNHRFYHYGENRTVTINRTNERVRGTITINKSDIDYLKCRTEGDNNQDFIPQGDASLAGAVYGLYANADIIRPDGKSAGRTGLPTNIRMDYCTGAVSEPNSHKNHGSNNIFGTDKGTASGYYVRFYFANSFSSLSMSF